VLREMLLGRPHDGLLSKNISELVAAIGCVCIGSEETGMLLRLSWKFASEFRPLLVPSLVKMASSGQSCSYLRFSPDADCERSVARMPLHGSERLWPPLAGYSFACWLYIESFDNGVIRLFELSAASRKSVANEQHVTTIYLNKQAGCLSIQSSSTDILTFSSFRFQEHAWYHIVVIHSHHMLHSSVAALYVNGLLREQGQLRSGLSLKTAMLHQVHGVVSATSVSLSAAFGSSGPEAVNSSVSWRLRSALLIEEPLTPENIYDLYWTGQAFNRYQGTIAECEDQDIAESAFIYKSIDSTDETEFGLSNILSPQSWSGKIVLSAHFGSSDLSSENGDCVASWTDIGGDGVSECDDLGLTKVRDLIVGQEWQLDGSVAIINCQSIGDAIRSCGGMPAILAMLEKSESSSDLLNLLRLMRNLLWGNVYNLCQMARIKGYEVLGRILQSKAWLIDSKNVLELMKIVGMGTIPTLSIVANADACRHLLVDFRIWRTADPSLVPEAFHGLSLFIKRNIRREFNTKKFKDINLVPFLCLHLCQQHLSERGVDSVIELLSAYVTMEIRQSDLQEVANLILSAAKGHNRPVTTISGERTTGKIECAQHSHSFKITRELLSIILSLVRSAEPNTIEGIATVLEPEWFEALLTQAGEATSVLSILILVRLCFFTSISNLIFLFGVSDFGWTCAI
jgi:hypothetical protein